MLYYTWFFALLSVCNGQIIFQDVYGKLTDSIQLDCTLPSESYADAVVWRRIQSSGLANVAAYSDLLGSVIYPKYEDKVFINKTNNGTTLKITNVTEADMGCYRCIFNITRRGDVFGEPCLKIVTEPIVFISASSTESQVFITCTATSFPAPAVSWKELGWKKTLTNSTNPNGTITVATTIQGTVDDSIKATCQVSHMGKESYYTCFWDSLNKPLEPIAAFMLWVGIWFAFMVLMWLIVPCL